MASYPTPAATRATSGALAIPNVGAMLRGVSASAILDAVWVPAVSALLVVVAGYVGYKLKQPWLFAALGPTVLMMAANPGHETTRFRAVVVAHVAAIACSYLALLVLSAADAPAVLASAKQFSPRIWASALALALLAVVQPQLRAHHAPAAATALLITLGAYRMTGRTPLALIGSVVLIAALAEGLQLLRPRRSR